jgi:hypothetical protein
MMKTVPRHCSPYDAANGTGSFLSMLISAPEPGTAAIGGFDVLKKVMESFRRRQALLVIAGLSLLLMSRQASQAQQVIPNLLGNDFTDPSISITVSAGDQANSPVDEMPSKAVDNTTASKWLAFQPNGTFYNIQFNGGAQRAVNAYTISSANDAPERDPYAWTLSGSNDGATFTTIDARTHQDFVTRLETQVFTFTNSVAFNIYRFNFQTALGAMAPGAPSTGAIQLSEIELFRSAPGEFNQDGAVDGVDFLAWQRGASPSPGSASDLADWRASFGRTSGSGSLASDAAVPEPSTALMLIAVAVGLLVHRRGWWHGRLTGRF